MTARVHGRYLGYPLEITERTVTVYRPDGRLLGVAYTVGGARRIVRGYRRSGSPGSAPSIPDALPSLGTTLHTVRGGDAEPGETRKEAHVD